MNIMPHHMVYSNYVIVLQVILGAIVVTFIVKLFFEKDINIESDKEFAIRNIKANYENGKISKEKYIEGIKEIESNM